MLKWEDGNDLESECDNGEWGRPVGKSQTSDIFKNQSKQFLDKIDIRVMALTPRTYQILTHINDFDLPKPNIQQRIRTQTQLNLIAMVLKIVHDHKIIDEATVATYTLNKEAWSVFMELIDNNKIKKLNLLIASSYSFRNAEQYEKFKIDSKIRKNIKLVFAWSHFKISLFKCKKNYYAIEGSMNYSQNNMAEQIVVENSKETYDYDYNFINNIMNNRVSSVKI